MIATDDKKEQTDAADGPLFGSSIKAAGGPVTDRAPRWLLRGDPRGLDRVALLKIEHRRKPSHGLSIAL